MMQRSLFTSGSPNAVCTLALCITSAVFVLAGNLGTARANHDVGMHRETLLFSPEGTAVLIRECDASSNQSALKVYNSTGTAIEQFDLSSLETHDLCAKTPQEILDLVRTAEGPSSLKGLLARHRLTISPRQSAFSPQQDRYIMVMEDKSELLMEVFSGERRRWIKVQELHNHLCSNINLSVSWHPNGKLAVVAGSRVTGTREDGYVVEWSPVLRVIAFDKPAPGKLTLVHAAREFNTLGKRYFKKGCNEEALVAFRNAIKLRPRYDRAHYNAARVYAQFDDRTQVFKHMRQLREINTETARKSLRKAPLDRAFSSLRKDPTFKKLTAP